MIKVVLDTNLYVGWLNQGLHEALVVGPGFVRYLSSVVLMELRVGAATRPARRLLDQLVHAHTTSARLVAPSTAAFDEAGVALAAAVRIAILVAASSRDRTRLRRRLDVHPAPRPHQPSRCLRDAEVLAKHCELWTVESVDVARDVTPAGGATLTRVRAP